jgi:hypothetical protein
MCEKMCPGCPALTGIDTRISSAEYDRRSGEGLLVAYTELADASREVQRWEIAAAVDEIFDPEAPTVMAARIIQGLNFEPVDTKALDRKIETCHRDIIEARGTAVRLTTSRKEIADNCSSEGPRRWRLGRLSIVSCVSAARPPEGISRRKITWH